MRCSLFIKISILYLLIVTTVSSGIVAGERTLFVRGLAVALREYPLMKSRILLRLQRGTPVLLVERKDVWLKVQAKNQQGWLLRGQLSKFPIKIKKSVLAQKVRLHSRTSRRVRLRTVIAVIGVRGLVDQKGQKISPYHTDYAALEWIEQQNLNEDDSIAFLMFEEDR